MLLYYDWQVHITGDVAAAAAAGAGDTAYNVLRLLL